MNVTYVKVACEINKYLTKLNTMVCSVVINICNYMKKANTG